MQSIKESSDSLMSQITFQKEAAGSPDNEQEIRKNLTGNFASRESIKF